MQTAVVTCAAIPARDIEADLAAAFGARADARRQRDAEDAARRAAKRAANPARSQLIAMPRMALLMKAGALLGSAKALAEALGIADRTLRAKTGAERGVTDDDLRAAADALDLRAAALTQHAQKLRDEAGA